VKLNPNEIYHIYNRGNKKQQIFYEEENYRYFLKKVRKYLVPYCDILAYSLMPNHFHFMIYVNEVTNLPFRKTNRLPERKKKPRVNMTLFSWGLQQLLSSYAKGINKRFNRTGSLFQQNTKSKKTSSDLFSEDYSLWCFIYINNNPKLAGLVNSSEDYEFASFKDFLGMRPDPICNISLAKKLLSLDENELFTKQEIELPADILKHIR
jgi:putative transposase